MFDIDIYLKCLSLNKEKASLIFLNDLISNHLSKFSFNNLRVFFSPGQILNLELNHLFQLCIQDKQGGYCFELNKTFFYLLNGLGFNVKATLARVHYNNQGEFPRTHRISIVDYEGVKYLCDVGFGPYCPNMPVPLKGTQVDRFGRTFRIIETKKCYELEILRDGSFFSLYQFEDISIFNEKDFDLSNFYTNTHPDSKFLKELIVSKIDGDVVQFINNCNFTTINHNKKEQSTISGPEEFHKLLSLFSLVGKYDFKRLVL